MADPGAPSSRPTFLVRGREERVLADRLRSMVVEHATNAISRCEATFDNWGAGGFLYDDRQLLDFGVDLQVSFEREVLFDGRITALEAHYPPSGQPTLTALAEDRLQDLRMVRRTRTFEETSDSALFSRIAQDHGLTPDVQLSGPTHKSLAQVNQTDLGLLQDRARAIGCRFHVNGRTLKATTSASSSQPIELQRQQQIRELSVIADLAHQRSSVTVGGWDVAAKRAISERATDSVIAGELRGGRSGPNTLGSLGERKEVVMHGAPVTADEARTRAEAHLRELSRSFVTARGIAEPDGRLRVGEDIKLIGLGPLFTGRYSLTEVRHLFDGHHGLRVEFVARAAAIGQSAS